MVTDIRDVIGAGEDDQAAMNTVQEAAMCRSPSPVPPRAATLDGGSAAEEGVHTAVQAICATRD